MDEITKWEMNLMIENMSQECIGLIFSQLEEKINITRKHEISVIFENVEHEYMETLLNKLVQDINEAGGMVGGGYYEYNDEGGGDE